MAAKPRAGVIKADGTSELRKFTNSRAPDGVSHAAGLTKYGARHSKEDLSRVQLMHDTSVALGADCIAAHDAEPDDGDEAFKLAKLDLGNLARDAAKSAIAHIAPKLDELGKRLDALETMPMPGGPLAATMAISKTLDVRGAEGARDPITTFERHLDSLSPAQRAHTLTKLALKNPMSR